MKTLNDVKWDAEHKLFRGTTFGELKIGRKKYTLAKGAMLGGGYTIGGNFDGEYQEIDVATAEDMNDIIKDL